MLLHSIDRIQTTMWSYMAARVQPPNRSEDNAIRWLRGYDSEIRADLNVPVDIRYFKAAT